MLVPRVSERPMSHPSKVPKMPPNRPITPASTKKSRLTSPSAAPSAFRTPISRRRSRMAITRVLMMPRVATASARLPKMPRRRSKTEKKMRRLLEASRREKALKPRSLSLASVASTSEGLFKPTYSSLTVRVKSPSLVEATEAKLKDLGFSAFSLLDASKSLRIFFSVFDLLLGIFGSLALAVATLGIINTLVMAILERRREIGVLKALGAADGDVKRLFFVEAGVMGLFGGIFGTLLGWLIGRSLTLGTNIYLHRQNLPGVDISSVPWWLVLLSILFAVGVSLAAGLYPASRAARLDPVQALRYE